MRGFRARDADRDGHVELIEAAYVDGQIGEADRELRIGRALSAETLDELETLTRDLQRPAGHVAPTQPAAAAPQTRRIAGLLVVLGVVVALLGAVIASIVVLASAGPDSTTSTRVTEITVHSESSSSTETVTTTTHELAPATVRRFVKAYERKFGTSEAFEVSFFPDRIQAQVPVRGTRSRMEGWSWDGQWRRDTTAAAVLGPQQRVDAGAIDVGRMFANIEVARRTLDVEDAVFTHAILMRWTDGPADLNIYVSNDFAESGFLSSTPAGDITRRHPFAP